MFFEGIRMPRWQRIGKRLLLVLLVGCITIKVHLDLKLLSSPSSTLYSPWEKNDTSHQLNSHRINNESLSRISGSEFLEAARIQNVGLSGSILEDFKGRQQHLLQQHHRNNEIWNNPKEFKKDSRLDLQSSSYKKLHQNSNNSLNVDLIDKIDGVIKILNEGNVTYKQYATENRVLLSLDKENSAFKYIDNVKQVKILKIDRSYSDQISKELNKTKEVMRSLNSSLKIERRKINNNNSIEQDAFLINKKIYNIDIDRNKVENNKSSTKYNSQINFESSEYKEKSKSKYLNKQKELESSVEKKGFQLDSHANKSQNITQDNVNPAATPVKGKNDIEEEHKKSDFHLETKSPIIKPKIEELKTLESKKVGPEAFQKIVQKVKSDKNPATKAKESSSDPDKPHHIPIKRRVTNIKPKQTAPKPSVKRPAPPSKKSVSKGVAVSHKIDEAEMSLTDAEITNVTKLIKQINHEQTIFNSDKYGPITNDTVVFIIQVHNRLVNLQHLVESLAAAQGINSSLVVFSHDLWHPDITKFIKGITSFRHMQMFFPFSIQFNPRTFPGRDPRDCGWNILKNPNLKCLNREWPDSYGHFREAGFTQIKHHWWWKIHRLFEEVRVLRGGSWLGKVVFLEEDHLVAPDILHVLMLMNKQRPQLCPLCNVITLGNYNKLSPSSYQNNVEHGDWYVTKYNLGFVIDYWIWQGIKACGIQFCEYDDYNWDWTLSKLIHTCIKPKLTMLSIKFSRVMHVGSCGTHVRKNNCDIGKEVAAVKQRYKTGQQWLFPKNLKMQGKHRPSPNPKKGNGGWGDFRDKMLCRAMSDGKATQNTIKSLQFNQQHENR